MVWLRYKLGATPSIASGLFCANTNNGAENNMINKRFIMLIIFSSQRWEILLVSGTIITTVLFSLTNFFCTPYARGVFKIVAPDFGRWGHRPRLGRGLCPHKPPAIATILNAPYAKELFKNHVAQSY